MDEADVSAAGRRRRWSLEDKRAVVAMSLDPDCSMAEIVTCFGLAPNQVYAWRRELRDLAEADACEDAPMFLPAVVEPTPAAATMFMPDAAEGRLLPDALVQIAMEVRGVPVMIAHGANPELVASVIAALVTAR